MHQMWLKNVFGSIRPHSEPQNAEQLRIEFVSKKKEKSKSAANRIVGDILTLIRLNVRLKRVCVEIRKNYENKVLHEILYILVT